MNIFGKLNFLNMFQYKYFYFIMIIFKYFFQIILDFEGDNIGFYIYENFQ